MRTLGTFLAVGILALTVGCGGSGSPSLDGGGAGGVTQSTFGNGGTSGGNGGIFGGNGGASGGGGSTGACNYPSCLASLGTTCAPSGTCVEQTDTTTFATNDCYSNGVKVLTSFDLTSGAIVATFKNASGICYTFNIGASTTGASTYTIKNGSGQTIATGTSDTAGTTTTITCTGGQPVTLNSACDTSGTSSSASCTTGTCTP